jgi:glycosyltransferase involved in cell wall biosynthesis
MARIFVFSPDLPKPLGGVRQLYRHVDVLNANGFDATIVHRRKGFKIKWFEHETRVSYEPVAMGKDDVAVFPEIWGAKIRGYGKSIRKVIFNQNAYYTFMGNPLRGRLIVPYTDPRVVATIVVSEDSRRYLEYVFPRMAVHRIRYGLNPKLYYPQKKKKQICLMPRKNVEDVKQVLHILNLRGALRGWKVVLIDKFTEAQTAAVMRESAIFLSFGHPEGFGLPPAEALACRCIVIGYHGNGGEEFLLPEFCYPIRVGDIMGFVQTVERVVREMPGNRSEFEAKMKAGAELVAREYSEERQRESIVSCWRKILGS